MNGILHETSAVVWGNLSPEALLAQEPGFATGFGIGQATGFVQALLLQVWPFLLSLLGAIAILIGGWIVATIVAGIIKKLLHSTNLDNRIASAVMGRPPGDEMPPTEKWISNTVYWLIMIFVLVAFLQALNLEVVSQPLNRFLEQIFAYLPKIGGAAVLLGVAWILATLSKMLLTRGLEQFRLDERLAEQTGQTTDPQTPGESRFLLNETLGNALYWFIFLFFLPLILDALELNVLPVQNLVNDFMSAVPKILMALIIGVVGWFMARIVRGIVTNLLAATGTDRLGAQLGLSRTPDGMSLSQLIGTIVYILILIPTAIAALNALEIAAISVPAIAMLSQILFAIPLILTAGLILALFYAIAKFTSDLVIRILRSIGFNNIFSWLGLPTTGSGNSPQPPPANSPDMRSGQQTVVQPPSTSTRTPAEIVGIVTWVGIMLFGAVAATEVLQLPALTIIMQGLLVIAGQVLVGLIVFGIGLYLANLAYHLISGSRGSQSQLLAQAARIAIIALAGAMALQQMGIAPHIVNLAFGLLFGAVAVAIALAFGLGGRDVASEQLREWRSDFKQRQEK
ncbi:mechanosensitive ion channel [Phormidium pseudopriestleyi FRX01]|uniref:Mechanosensitive ion channel n=1 Tax=Phormidium pseudopriestleyi FRX01 TaxID=1759528 RepID=A0ABS3FRZ6_9CYAN|nr:mechanosensitive ion channel [Phormidium pseudopriestleyi]MBO0349865.1 mechanosensitive ion channel [Phormidium pseudopriestleyi FRX01]